MKLLVHYSNVKVVTYLALTTAVLLTSFGSLSFDLPQPNDSDMSVSLGARSEEIRIMRQLRQLTSTFRPLEKPITLAQSTTQNPEEVAQQKWLEEQERRRRHMEDKCHGDITTVEMALATSTGSGYDFIDLAIVDEQHKVIYCAAPKVATTNWKRVFLILSGKAKANGEDFDKFNPHDPANFKLLKSYSMEQRVEMVRNFRKFLFVRHPFNRIDSAFYDRLHYDPLVIDNFKQLIGTQIIARYRPKKFTSAKSLKEGHDVRFSELVQYLTDQSNPKRQENGHFAGISRLCYPCQLNYTYVGKYESLVKDARMILAQLNASLPFIFPATTNVLSKTAERWTMDMRSLTPELRHALYREYRDDFRIFGYDPNDWKLL